MDNESHFMTFLKIIRNDQEFYMRQQWKVTNYALLLYGAIIYILKEVVDWNINCKERIIFATISLIIFFIAISLLCMLEISIGETRKMANKVYKSVPHVGNIIRVTTGQSIKDSNEMPFRKSVVFIFGSVIFSACASIFWILFKTIDC